MNIPACLKKYEMDAVFKAGPKVSFRPIQPTDGALLEELFYSHSEQTVVHRYFAHVHYLSPAQVHRFVVLDYEKDFALVGLAPHQGRVRMVCVGRYCRNPASREAEVAITVHDDFQNRGIGAFLLATLVRVAREQGLIAFTGSVLAANAAMMHVFNKMGRVKVKREADIYEVRLDLTDGTAAPETVRPAKDGHCPARQG